MQTTLYDLIEAVSAAVQPGEEALITPITVKLLRSHRAKFIGKRTRRQVCHKASYLNSASA